MNIAEDARRVEGNATEGSPPGIRKRDGQHWSATGKGSGARPRFDPHRGRAAISAAADGTLSRNREGPSMAVIDADTHVDDTEDTWEYLLPSERAFRPTCVTDDHDGKRYWLIDGSRFLRLPRQFNRTG